jgi:hypothetical protein
MSARTFAAIRAHVRVVVRRRGRRINDGFGHTFTACGGTLTAYDVPYTDAKRMSAADRAKWIGCDACRAQVQQEFPK